MLMGRLFSMSGDVFEQAQIRTLEARGIPMLNPDVFLRDDFDFKARLFQRFPDRALGRRFIQLDMPAGRKPFSQLGMGDKKHLSVLDDISCRSKMFFH
jgi:hypothetical protein